MDTATIWYLIAGFVLILIGLTTSFIEKLPLTTSIIYFVFGVIIGNHGFGWISYDLIKDSVFFEKITEVVVLVSLFSAGLKLRLPFRDSHWSSCWRLATVSMIVTVGLIAVFSVYVLNMSWGMGVLLGAVLAPTDPVLASDVQVSHAEDKDRLRFSLTGEAGLNDGTAFPFVMLGLGLLGLHEIGEFGLKWFFADVLWKGIGGIAVGWILGTLVSKIVLKLRAHNDETMILDDFLAVGLIAMSYGVAHLTVTWGFLAVFAAGLAMRKIEKHPTGEPVNSSQEGPTTMVKAVLSFTEQMERIGEVFVVILLGALMNVRTFQTADIWLIPVMFFLIRPIAVFIGLIGIKMRHYRKPLISWFGIRGIGSLYYITYAINHKLPPDIAERLTAVTYATVVVSIFVHGISGLPFMNFYQSKRKQAKAEERRV